MSQSIQTKTLDEIRREELQHLVERRRRAKLARAETQLRACLDDPSHAESDAKLVGLSLSGGGLRSACFSTGFLQALHQTGLWRFVDYLSTVSGGGYIGGHLTSAVLGEERPFDEQHFPLKEDPGHKQPSGIRRLIYQGHCLFKPWLLFNKWLIGVVLVNLAVFTGLLSVCVLVALLWRGLDLPWVRDRAKLLSLGDDLMAPFWPAIVFGAAWLVAWILSFYRRGSEALGNRARFFLYLAAPSFLIGLGLLVGNGDIAEASLFQSLLGKDTLTVKPEFWIPVVTLTAVALLPLLRPRRLLESGLRPRKKWERGVFYVVGVALLAGLPLCLVGFFSRENISGYNDAPYRPMIWEDIQGWPSLQALLLPDTNDEFLGTGERRAAAFRYSLVRMPPDEGLALGSDAKIGRNVEDFLGQHAVKPPTPEALKKLQDAIAEGELPAPSYGGKTTTADIRISRAWALWQLAEVPDDLCVRSNGTMPATAHANARLDAVVETILGGPIRAPQKLPLVLLGRTFRGEAVREYLRQCQQRWLSDPSASGATAGDVSRDASQLEFLLDGPPSEGGEPAWRPVALQHPWEFLYLRVWELECLSLAVENRQHAVMDDVHYYGRESWWQPVSGYLVRLYGVFGWMIGQDNAVRQFWDARQRQEMLQGQICFVLDRYVLPDRTLLDRQTEIFAAAFRDPVQGQGSGGVSPANERWRETLKSSAAAYDASFGQLVTRTLLAGVEDLPAADVSRLNRLFLEQGFPDIFRPRSEVRRRVSIYEDQWSRFRWFAVCLVLFLAAACLDLNAVSMHHYYRDRLVQAFLVYKSGKTRSIPLVDANAAAFGSPYHLISCTIGAPGRVSLSTSQDDMPLAEATPEKDRRWQDSFLLSSQFCGSETTGYVETGEYERRILGDLNRLTLAEAIAISGAALSPGHSRNWFLTFLMLAFNLRLGQWLPNPQRDRPRTRPRLLVLLASLLQRCERRPYCFLTDGGMSENLGLIHLLHRRCRLILAVDAGHDPHHIFTDLARLRRLARIHSGVQLVGIGAAAKTTGEELQMERLAPRRPAGESERDQPPLPLQVKDHVQLVRIIYPDAEEGLLIYVKPSFTGDESLDLAEYRQLHPDFPHESTADQNYDPEQVESYRQLGYHVGLRVGRLFPPLRDGGTLWGESVGENVTADELRAWALQSAAAHPEPARATAGSPTGPAAKPPLEEPSGDFARRQRLLCRLRSEVTDWSKFQLGRLSETLESEDEFASATLADVSQTMRETLGDLRHAPAERAFAARLLVELEADPGAAEEREATVPQLTAALQSDPDEQVRAACADALGVLCRQGPVLADVPKALSQALKDSSLAVRERAMLALRHLDLQAEAWTSS